MKERRKWSHSVMSDSLWPHELQPTRLLHPWDFPGKSTGVGCHFFLQGIFLTQESNLGLPHCRQTLLPSEPPGKPDYSLRTKKLQPPRWEMWIFFFFLLQNFSKACWVLMTKSPPWEKYFSPYLGRNILKFPVQLDSFLDVWKTEAISSTK